MTAAIFVPAIIRDTTAVKTWRNKKQKVRQKLQLGPKSRFASSPVARGRAHPVQEAFIEHDALQCGFCTPGMVMSCAALLDHNPHCTLDDVKTAVSGHLCRCGTYPNIFKAALAAASHSRDSRRSVSHE